MNQSVSDVHSVDPASGQRRSLPPMSVARCGHVCVVTEGFLYVLGGYYWSEDDVEEELSSCERYSWTRERQVE